MNRNLAGSPYCPICHEAGFKYLEFEEQTLYRCRGCASLFYSPFTDGEGGSLYEALGSCSFYLERGANLLFYTEIIYYLHEVLRARSRADFGGSLAGLEVGCNYGFLMDMARWAYGWSMAGIDPGPCAAQGMEELGLDITQAGLEEMEGQGLYDIIISVETIEHVSNPREHMSCMARLLRNNGLIILTTPDSSHDNLGPQLWPGEHHVIFSRNGLVRLLNEVGMTHHCFFTTSIAEILGVVASREPFPTAAISGATPSAMGRVMRTTVDYLRFKVRSAQYPALLARGLHFRLFELLVNLGRYSEAERIGQIVDRLLGLEPNHSSPSALGRVAHAMTDAPDLERYLAAGPGCLAPYLFLKGVLYLNYRWDYSGAFRFFGYAAQLFRKEVEDFGLTHFQTFLTAAESHANLATLLAQRPMPWHKRLFLKTAWWRRAQ